MLALLRREPATVESLARALDVSANAVRLHLASLERSGLVHIQAVRREGVGKPAHIYAVVDDADLQLSQAHAPLLRALIDELSERLSPRELSALLKTTGRRAAGQTAHGHGPLTSRAATAVKQLEALGAQVRVQTHAGQVSVESDGCVIGSIVTHHPQACAAIASLVGALSGANATVACDRRGTPRCSFHLSD